MNIEKQLYQLAKNSGINYDLSNITQALSLLGNPHKNNRYIHIAGTNGKGTTADFIAQILEDNKQTIGLYTSPHLISYTERFKINGIPITQTKLSAYLQRIQEKIIDIPLTEFEILTLIAFLYYQDARPDFVVMETGLGGRLDATNVITPEITVIATISFDHQDYLGNTLTEIAKEKAGIMKPKTPLITFENTPKINSLFIEKAKQLNCPIHFVKHKNSDYLLNNKILAEKAASVLGFRSSKLIQTRLDGRMQKISENPFILFDSAHNIEGIKTLKNYIKKHNLKTDIIFSVSQKPIKNIKKMAKELSSIADTLYITEFDFYKAVSLSQLTEITKELKNCKILPKKTLLPFLQTAQQNIIATGSIYFVANLITFLKNK